MSAIETQKVPAWKRLGLKLKQPAAARTESPNGSSSIGAVGHPSSSAAQSSPKRKLAPHASQLNPIHGNKRPRRDESPKSKKVTFGDTPTKKDIAGKKSSDVRTPAAAAAKKGPKPKNKSPAKQPPTLDLKPALEYLRLWKTSRESWKFNKNHQSSLIKHIFDGPDAIPSADVDYFYEYIRDIKGFIRTRLVETAMEIRTRDESDGYASFPEGTTDVDEKQTAYDSVLAGILRRRQAGKRKFFSESQYVSENEDGEVIVRRLIKRMRAELVLNELSDSEESTTTSTSSSSKTVTASDDINTVTTDQDKTNTVTTDQDKQITVNGAPSRRRRKLRVNVDDSSSSESESESESESSSSSSSEDSDSEEEERPDEDETSSSSSSSSSEDGSDSESGEESDEDE